ncbi:protein PFC0760c-like [Cynara cardunculus var. scolymus]|uniref:protein PFC0760c-like n=1 Tax=Cynara cardunculus var. scolymus TaxID=59895 RepID=UPI000D624E44|nr:protein PFC0760c-like [Cynara cardunculus var. scolymus]
MVVDEPSKNTYIELLYHPGKVEVILTTLLQKRSVWLSTWQFGHEDIGGSVGGDSDHAEQGVSNNESSLEDTNSDDNDNQAVESSVDDDSDDDNDDGDNNMYDAEPIQTNIDDFQQIEFNFEDSIPDFDIEEEIDNIMEDLRRRTRENKRRRVTTFVVGTHSLSVSIEKDIVHPTMKLHTPGHSDTSQQDDSDHHEEKTKRQRVAESSGFTGGESENNEASKEHNNDYSGERVTGRELVLYVNLEIEPMVEKLEVSRAEMRRILGVSADFIDDNAEAEGGDQEFFVKSGEEDVDSDDLMFEFEANLNDNESKFPFLNVLNKKHVP